MRTAISEDQLRGVLAERMRIAGSARKLAAEIGFSESIISLTINGKREIGAKLARALGYERGWIGVPPSRNASRQTETANT